MLRTTLVRGAFISTSVKPLSDRAQAAFNWLCENNTIYHYWYQRHEKWLSTRVLGDSGFSSPWFKTSDLLLNTEGFEVAFRPWLYPLASFCDTNIRPRLKALGRAEDSSHCSIKDSVMHKMCSRVQDYSQDFKLQCYLYDVSSARTFMTILYTAEDKKCPPEIIAVGNHNFDVYWHNQHRYLTDRCRVRGVPNVFLTIAPAEWKFPLHSPLFSRYSLLLSVPYITYGSVCSLQSEYMLCTLCGVWYSHCLLCVMHHAFCFGYCASCISTLCSVYYV